MKVSVGLAVYNGERFLERCLDCLTTQTLDELEIIVVDDGRNGYVVPVHQPHALAEAMLRYSLCRMMRSC